MQTFGIQNRLIELGMTYGLEYYEHQTTEECAELIQALNKMFRHKNRGEYEGKQNELKDHLFEEIADVEICLGILKNLYHCEEEVYDWKRKKISRQFKRLEAEGSSHS